MGKPKQKKASPRDPGRIVASQIVEVPKEDEEDVALEVDLALASLIAEVGDNIGHDFDLEAQNVTRLSNQAGRSRLLVTITGRRARKPVWLN